MFSCSNNDLKTQFTTGVLTQKKKAEDKLKESGLPYTIVRPGRLTDGPYTSMDVNTLLKATSGERQDVQISSKDDLQDEASRIAVAGKRLCLSSRDFHNSPQSSKLL